MSESGSEAQHHSGEGGRDVLTRCIKHFATRCALESRSGGHMHSSQEDFHVGSQIRRQLQSVII